jgi:hypothetical protein
MYDKTSRIIFIIDNGVIYDEMKHDIDDKKYEKYKDEKHVFVPKPTLVERKKEILH